MDFIKETLTWINDVRAEHNIGDPLDDIPKGLRRAPSRCPIACALLARAVSPNYGVAHDWYDEPGHIELPESVKQFVRAFDNGELPEYEETS